MFYWEQEASDENMSYFTSYEKWENIRIGVEDCKPQGQLLVTIIKIIFAKIDRENNFHYS